MRSIIGLLKPYLKHAWVVDAAVMEAAVMEAVAPTDLCLINMDHPGAPRVPPGQPSPSAAVTTTLFWSVPVAVGLIVAWAM